MICVPTHLSEINLNGLILLYCCLKSYRIENQYFNIRIRQDSEKISRSVGMSAWQRIGCRNSGGKKGTKEPDSETAVKINEKCFHKGLLMFAPVGIAGEYIKIAPPLIISKEALIEGISVLEDACDEILGSK